VDVKARNKVIVLIAQPISVCLPIELVFCKYIIFSFFLFCVLCTKRIQLTHNGEVVFICVRPSLKLGSQRKDLRIRLNKLEHNVRAPRLSFVEEGLLSEICLRKVRLLLQYPVDSYRNYVYVWQQL
jgi:hypothetical protein